jgi:spore germination protein KA
MVGKDLNANKAYYKRRFNGDHTIVFREFESDCGGLRCCIIYSDGMIDHQVINRDIILPIQRLNLEKKNPQLNLVTYLKKRIIIVDGISYEVEAETIINGILYGDTVLIMDGYDIALLIQTKGWEKRPVSEPKVERVIFGPKEAFTESILTNVSLIRKRITCPNLKFESYVLGKQTKTKVFLIYIEGLAPEDRIKELRRQLRLIHLDALIDIKEIGEEIHPQGYTIFSMSGFSERPDVITSKLLEGRIAIACDGSPEVLYVPNFFYEQFIIHEDYYNNYIFSIINRLLRIIAFILTTCTPAIYIALIGFHQQMLPKQIFMSIASAREGVPFPSVLELVLLLITFEILREAGTRIPESIGGAVSIVGALILGDAAVRAQIISAPIVIVAAITGITSMMLIQTIQALIVIRLGLLLISSIFGLYGFIFGVMFITTHLLSLDSCGIPYMTYVYNIRKSRDAVVRLPLQHRKINTQKK